jgi:hypothetical protein
MRKPKLMTWNERAGKWRNAREPRKAKPRTPPPRAERFHGGDGMPPTAGMRVRDVLERTDTLAANKLEEARRRRAAALSMAQAGPETIELVADDDSAEDIGALASSRTKSVLVSTRSVTRCAARLATCGASSNASRRRRRCRQPPNC